MRFERLGFTGGMVFEPGMGVGHFLGMMPADIARAAKYQGMEMDHVTAQIAKLLYPQSGVRQADFTRTPMPRDTWVPIAISILTDADERRSLIIPTSGPLTGGTYRLRLDLDRPRWRAATPDEASNYRASATLAIELS